MRPAVTITITSDEPRTIKAISIAAGAAQWIKCRTKDGRKVYGIPSQRQAGQYHLVDNAECSCFDFQRRREPCKHVLAVRLHCELVKAQQPKPRAKKAKPAAAPAPADRSVVLSMVRHGDRDVTWEAHSHTAALASRYDSIYGTEAF
jgi:hypothetical protein